MLYILSAQPNSDSSQSGGHFLRSSDSPSTDSFSPQAHAHAPCSSALSPQGLLLQCTRPFQVQQQSSQMRGRPASRGLPQPAGEPGPWISVPASHPASQRSEQNQVQLLKATHSQLDSFFLLCLILPALPT